MALSPMITKIDNAFMFLATARDNIHQNYSRARDAAQVCSLMKMMTRKQGKTTKDVMTSL